MASRRVAWKAKNLLLGVCLPSLRHDASKFKVKELKLNNYFLYYYQEEREFYAYDPNKLCKTGDIVLLEELEKRMTKEINHQVVEVVYPLGDVIDPITGKSVVADRYRDDIEKIELAFGKRKNYFDYYKAPKRGWQEGKKDLSNREVYEKYHEFEKGDENEYQPYGRPSICK